MITLKTRRLLLAPWREEDAEALVEKVQAAFPNCEVELNDGGQPIYYYLLSVE